MTQFHTYDIRIHCYKIILFWKTSKNVNTWIEISIRSRNSVQERTKKYLFNTFERFIELFQRGINLFVQNQTKIMVLHLRFLKGHKYYNFVTKMIARREKINITNFSLQFCLSIWKRESLNKIDLFPLICGFSALFTVIDFRQCEECVKSVIGMKFILWTEAQDLLSTKNKASILSKAAPSTQNFEITIWLLSFYQNTNNDD